MQSVNLSTLSKKERIQFFKEEKKLEELKSYKKAQIKKWFIIVSIVIVGVFGLWFLLKESTKPLPGQPVAELGREHIPKDKWGKFIYNSNPPTSGPHDADWTRAGIYDEAQGEGNLVHSLEHGYVIISYNCMRLNSKLKTQNSKIKETKECEELKKQLSDVAKEERLWKLIVVPRPNLDSVIALTAWTYIDKFNAFDKERISRFINAHRDHGPEKTME